MRAGRYETGSEGKFASRWRAKSPDALCAVLPLFTCMNSTDTPLKTAGILLFRDREIPANRSAACGGETVRNWCRIAGRRREDTPDMPCVPVSGGCVPFPVAGKAACRCRRSAAACNASLRACPPDGHTGTARNPLLCQWEHLPCRRWKVPRRPVPDRSFGCCPVAVPRRRQTWQSDRCRWCRCPAGIPDERAAAETVPQRRSPACPRGVTVRGAPACRQACCRQCRNLFLPAQGRLSQRGRGRRELRSR